MNPLLIITVCILLVASSGCVQENNEKAYHVGILGGMTAFSEIDNGFKAGMEELGYIEGNNIVYDERVDNFNEEELLQVSEDFVKDGVDMIFAFPTEPALAAKAATEGTDIPVVFSIAGIEGNDLVESARNPGGHVTGVRYPGPDLVAKRLEILMELAPNVKRLYIPHDPNYPNSPPALESIKNTAIPYGITIIEAPITSLEELEADLRARNASGDIGMDAIQILPESLTQTPDVWAAISSFASEHRIPLVGSALPSANMGGVFSYCVDFFEVGHDAAPIANKIFRGTDPGTISLITPEPHFRLNYGLAKELGLNVTEGLLARADDVIQ